MKVSPVNSATSLSFSRRNKQVYYENHPPITYDTHKIKNTLLCLAGIGIAGVTLLAIKDAGNNAVKNLYNSAKNVVKDIMPEPSIMAIGNKRNAVAVNKYNASKAKIKLAKLEKRIASGEFINAPEHVTKNIEKQTVRLIKQCTQPILA